MIDHPTRRPAAAVITIAVIPHAFDEVSRLAATATVAGFVLGYLLS